jgi:hypothetical protein
MPPFLRSVLNYLGQGGLLTLEQLLLVLGPLLAIALLLQQLSGYVRNRSAAVFGRGFYVYLTAPGVMVHELGHAFFCVLFRHRIVRMQLFRPSPDGTLGYVEHAYNRRSLYQSVGNFFIGTGPIWFGSALIYLLSVWLLGSWVNAPASRVNAPNAGDLAGLGAVVPQVLDAVGRLFAALLRPSLLSTWQFWVYAYLVFCIGSHVTLSPPDVRGASKGFVVLVAVLLAFNLLTLWAGGGLSVSACTRVVRESAVLYAVLLFVAGLNIGLSALIFILARATGR